MLKVETIKLGLKRVKLIEVTNDVGLKLVLCNIGASIYKCYIDEQKVSYESSSLNEFISSREYYGKTAGRTAGRIRNGTFVLNGKECHLKNGKFHSLHGGEGFSFKKYDTLIKENENEYSVIFDYVSKDKENGYPGILVNQIEYVIYKDKLTFEVRLKAISSKDTVCNLTNHTYWNLKNDSNSIILKHKVSIFASKYVIIDNDLLKVAINDVDKVFDFRKGKYIGTDIEDASLQNVALGYDHDWILDKDKGDLALSLINDDETLKLDVYTSNPVCHIYTGNYMKEKYRAMAIEMQRRIFDIDDGGVTLPKGDKYFEYIRYEFNKMR